MAIDISSLSQGVIRSDFWFPDGNIVLITGSSAFKVHRGQLQRHSEIFNDLFTIPQPENQELFEGCLCVEIHDCPSDVWYFLRALYDGLYFQKPFSDDFPAIAAVLRLSTKYLVEHLRRHCLMRLQFEWPSTLAGWDRREREAVDDLGRYIPRDSFSHPIPVIDLARELGLGSLLPSAFYDLSRYGPSKIMTGTPAPLPVLPIPSVPPDFADDLSTLHLSHLCLFRTLRGRESAQQFITTFIDKELTIRPISAGCTNSHDHAGRFCRESFYFIKLNILRSVGGISSGRDGDPLFTLLQAVDMLSRTDFSDGVKQCGLKMCNPCKVDFASAVGRAREEAWSLIPGWFGLDN